MPRRERVLSAFRVAGRTMAGHPAMTGTHYPHVKHRKCRENFAQVDRKCEIRSGALRSTQSAVLPERGSRRILSGGKRSVASGAAPRWTPIRDDYVSSKISFAARRPLAMAPWTVPLWPVVSVCSPAKNNVFLTGEASVAWQPSPPAFT